MSKQVLKRSWLYSWGSRAQGAEKDSVIDTTEVPHISHDVTANNGGSQATDLPEYETRVKLLASLKSGHSTEREKEVLLPAQSDERLGSSSSPPIMLPNKKLSQERSLELKLVLSTKAAITHRPSTTSLRSYATSNWLGWGSKDTRSYSLPEEDLRVESIGQSPLLDFEAVDDQNTIGDYGEGPVSTDSGYDTKNKTPAVMEVPSRDRSRSPRKLSRDTTLAVAKRDSLPSRKSESSSTSRVPDRNTSPRKKAWSFWGLSEDTKNKADAHTHSRFTNTILKSSPGLLSRHELQAPGSESPSMKDSARGTGSRPGLPQKGKSPTTLKNDDAVLYESHKSAEEYNRINTQSNDNLKENILVPDWNTCLKVHGNNQSVSTTLEFYDSSTSLVSHALNIKAWISYLARFSSKLGLTSSGNHEEGSFDGEGNEYDAEDLFRSSRERSYKLYGQSLCRLPLHKRACLPNYSKYYTSKRRKVLNDNEPVSISNDSVGNLLINCDNTDDKITAQLDICNQNVKPLRKINKILIIGVHGFFPTRMVRPLIGAPKGTSSKFANEAEKAVIRYLLENDMMREDASQDVSIQKIALEKEGKIFDRVDFFLQILSKWEHDLNEAEYVFIAAHSQGCVVSIILLAKLIKQGILKGVSHKRIGILAMAGVNNGPFYGVDNSFFLKAYSAIEHESMLELFELTKFDSPQSIAYKDAIQTIISVNVKLCLVGSINDQLVPLYSALASHIFHPNIYRACYIDSASKTPAFIQNLVSLCCQMQNMGFFDNNVIREISPILAGPLTGNGHSIIYNDGKVYDLGIKFMLDTDDLAVPKYDGTKDELIDGNVDVPITNSAFVREFNVGKIGTNPYILPWCLRGLVFNIQKNWRYYAKRSDGELTVAGEQVKTLYENFDQWRPETKALKELKFRLSGIRSSKL